MTVLLSIVCAVLLVALIATATVARHDVVPLLGRLTGRTVEVDTGKDPEHDVAANRLYVMVVGVVAIILAALIHDVLAALTIAYDVLVGGLLVAILGGLVWRRATGVGALASMAAGTAGTLITMWAVGDILANEPVYVGLAVSAVTYVIVSLATEPTPANIMAIWTARVAGRPDPIATPEGREEPAQS